MTSNRSFFNPRLLRETMRRNIWATALSFVGFFFCLPLPVAMTIQRNMAGRSLDPVELARTKAQTLDSVRMLLGTGNLFVKTGMVIMAVLCGIALFSYLHSRQRVDFYHALPMRRGALFLGNYLAGLLTVLPAFVIMYALSCMTAVTMGMGEAFTAGQAVQALVLHTLFFLLIYTISALAAILTGNTILAVLLDAWLLFSVAGAAAIAYGLGEMFLDTWSGNGTLDWLMRHTSPVVLYYSLSRDAQPGVPLLLGVLAMTAALGALGFALFGRRKSENAGTAVAFEGLKAPLKCYMVLIIALAMGMIISGIGGEFWIWFGLVAGTLLGHIILEMIYHFDVRAAFSSWKTMLALGVAAVLLVAGVQQDVMGYDKWIPSENQVQSVGFRAWAARRSGAPWSYSQDTTGAKLTDPACIAAVRELAEAGVAAVKSGELYADHMSAPYEEIWVSYQLKNGRTAERRYRMQITDQIWDAIDRARFTEDYIRHATPLFGLDLDAAGDSVVLEVRTQADSSDRVTTELRAPVQTREILETLREESLALTRAVATTTVPVLRMDVRYQLSERPYSSYEQRMEYIPVYPTYTRTLALLEQYGGITPRALTVDDLKNITIYDNRYNGKYAEKYGYEPGVADPDVAYEAKPPVVITDRAQMEALLRNAVTDQVASSCDNGLMLSGSERYSVQATYLNNQSTQLYYLGEAFPEALCASYFS